MRGAAEVRVVEVEGVQEFPAGGSTLKMSGTSNVSIRGDVGVVEEMLIGEAVGVVKLEEEVQVETSAEAA